MENRLGIFKQIHEIVFHGKGGYNWNDVYNMPIWLRSFTFNEINKYYIKLNNPDSKNESKNNKIHTLDIKSTKFKPTYT